MGFDKWWRLITLYLLSLGSQEGIVWGQCHFSFWGGRTVTTFRGITTLRAFSCFHFHFLWVHRKIAWGWHSLTRTTLCLRSMWFYPLMSLYDIHSQRKTLPEVDVVLPLDVVVQYLLSELPCGSHYSLLAFTFTFFGFREIHCLMWMWFDPSTLLYNIHSQSSPSSQQGELPPHPQFPPLGWNKLDDCPQPRG